MPIAAPDFAQLFTPGARHPFLDGSDLLVRERPAVPLSLPSGRVVAMEPFGCGYGDPEELAFVERVKPGTYPVVMVTVDVIGADGERHDTREAAARLVIRDEPVATWELALQKDQDAAELGDDEFFGYPVDGGTGCFVDADAFEPIADEEDFAERVLSSLFDKDPQVPAATPPQPVDGPVSLAAGDDEHALVVFFTGWGDGAYPTWVGRTADGEIACFLTDFRVLPVDDDDEDESAA